MSLITPYMCATTKDTIRRTIVFYDDSRVFGGHEIIFLEGLARILENKSIRCAVISSISNTALTQRLKTLHASNPRLDLYHISHSSSRFASVITFLSIFKVIRLSAFLKSLCPERAVIVQGNIEFSSLGLVASKIAGVRTTSYIPMINIRASSRNMIIGILKLPFNLILFRMADEFITISETAAASLKRLCGKTPVHIVYNGIVEKKSVARFTKTDLRKKLKIPHGARVISVIGRIQFSQKGHDILMRLAEKHGDSLERCRFLIVGEGSDESRMKEFISSRSLNCFFTFIPWTDDLKSIYRISDAVLMPSRYEGVPLVAIESIMESVPVILSDRIAALKNIIPSKFFFPLNDDTALIRLINKTPPLPGAVISRIKKLYSMERFKTQFAKAVCGRI